jgi:transcriptional regulator with XRE-family HTH domain
MVRADLTLEKVSAQMGITASTLSHKLNGKYPITLIEAKKFKRIVGSDLPIEILFEEAC